MTPSQEAKQILQDFFSCVGFYPQAKICAKLHVKKLIESLNKNQKYTQCLIDKNHYEYVLIELEVL